MKFIFTIILLVSLNVFAEMDCSKLTSQEYNSYESLSYLPGLGSLLSLSFSSPDSVTVCKTDYCIPGHHTFKCDGQEGKIEIYSSEKSYLTGYYNSDLDILIMNSDSSASTSNMLWMKRSEAL